MSAQPIAYDNGRMIPADQLSVAPQDLGFMWGVTVAEQLRTFNGQVFRCWSHLQRLRRGAELLGIDCPADSVLSGAIDEVVRHNIALAPEAADLGVTVYLTPGLSPTYAPGAAPLPRVAVHTYVLPFQLWANKYRQGQTCVLVGEQTAASCWPNELKCRSRAHYFLADREAARQQPGARAILCDAQGNVNEASTANVVTYFPQRGLVSPPLEHILPGVSLAELQRLAEAIGVPMTYERLTPQQLLESTEVLLTSTPFCILPVRGIGQVEFTERTIFERLMQAWSDSVGLDIVDQAVRCSSSG